MHSAITAEILRLQVYGAKAAEIPWHQGIITKDAEYENAAKMCMLKPKGKLCTNMKETTH